MNQNARMTLLRIVLVLGMIGAMAKPIIAETCGGKAAQALRNDSKRATQWNWGWGATLGAAAVFYGVFAYKTGDENLRISLGLGGVKSTLGTIKQVILPIRIYEPQAGCENLSQDLIAAGEIEDKRHGWISHALGVVVNVAGLFYVGYATDDWRLAAQGSILGIATGELIIYTTPNEVRSGGYGNGQWQGLEGLTVLPTFKNGSTGFVLGGRF